MNIFKDKNNNIEIVRLSKIGILVLIVSLFSSYLIQTSLYSHITELQSKKEQLEKTYEDLHEFKYQTELLLTSYNIEERKDQYKKTYLKYNESMENLLKDFDIKSDVKRNHKFVNLRLDEISNILSKKVFGVENHMYKPLLVRLGELNRSEEKSEYYLTIKSFFESINHLKQYQDFLLDDLEDIKNNITQNYNDRITVFNTLFTLLPVGVILLAVFFSVMIHRIISQREIELVNTKDLLSNIINSVPVRIFWKDTKGIYLGANKLFIDDARLEHEKEILGKNDFEMTWKEVAQSYVDDDKEVMESKKPKLNILETQAREDGTLSYLNTSKVPLFDENGKVSGVIGLYEDITQKYEDQRKIRQQEMQLIQQNRLAQMGEMISMIAHQWRQPLTVISSTCATLNLKVRKDKYDKEVFLNKLDRMTLQTKHLSDTIEDFRGFFKPEKKKKDVFASDLITDALSIIEPTLIDNSIRIESHFHCEKVLHTYSNEVKQVILNILRNSQDAFIENGINKPLIHINTSCSKNTKCTINIRDNAGGIDEDIIEKIFDPYFSTKSEKNGTGLGLYMSKMIIEDHCKGKLSVKSSGEESIFTIEL